MIPNGFVFVHVSPVVWDALLWSGLLILVRMSFYGLLSFRLDSLGLFLSSSFWPVWVWSTTLCSRHVHSFYFVLGTQAHVQIVLVSFGLSCLLCLRVLWCLFWSGLVGCVRFWWLVWNALLWSGRQVWSCSYGSGLVVFVCRTPMFALSGLPGIVAESILTLARLQERSLKQVRFQLKC